MDVHPDHPRHCKCNSHEDRPVRFVGCTPYDTQGHISDVPRTWGNILRCSNLWIVGGIVGGNANKETEEPFWNSWKFIKWQWSRVQIAEVQQQDNERTLACFCIRAQTVCPGYSLISRWLPKGMLPHSGRKIHHLHGRGHTHSQQTFLGGSFPGDASNKWLWHLPPEHHCSPATAPNLPLLGYSSPSMRPRLGCHPRSPTIQ